MRRGRRVAPSAGKRRCTLVTIEANCLFSPLRETSIVRGVFPQVSTLIHSSIGARALVRRVGAQVGALTVVSRAPPALRHRVEAAAGAGAGRCRARALECSACFCFVITRRMISQIVIIVGSNVGVAQVRMPKRSARF